MRSIALFFGFILGGALLSLGQATPTSFAQRGDVALTYDWVSTNAEPGDCGCFGLNGGGISASADFSVPLGRGCRDNRGTYRQCAGCGQFTYAKLLSGRDTLPDCRTLDERPPRSAALCPSTLGRHAFQRRSRRRSR